MSLEQLATAAGITRQTAAKRVKRLDLGIAMPGKQRRAFCDCDLVQLVTGLSSATMANLVRIK